MGSKEHVIVLLMIFVAEYLKYKQVDHCAVSLQTVNALANLGCFRFIECDSQWAQHD